MTWAHPAAFWFFLLLIPTVASSLAAVFSTRTHLAGMGGSRVSWQIRIFLRDFSMAGFVILSVFAIAGPRSGRMPVTGERSGLDVAVAFDVSRSMLARDIEPSRLERSTTALRQIAGSLEDTRFSINPFKGDAYTAVPMTEDRVIVDMWIDRLGPGLSSNAGTNIEAALETAEHSFPRGTGRKRIIILVSDGETLAGKPERYTRRLVDEGIPVYVLAAGTAAGSTIPLDNGEYVKDSGGRPVVSRTNVDSLRRIADDTGGAFYDLSKAGTVASIIETVDGERQFAETKGIRFVGVHRFRAFLLPALILLLVHLLARIVPWRG